jgi:MFS transporter, FHS family, Na+ dependent glucose transporter 1
MSSAVNRSLGYFALFACLGMEMAVVGPTLADLAHQTGSTVGEVGLVFLLGSAGVTVGTILGGWVTDRLPGRLMLGGAEIAAGTLLCLIPHLPSYALLLGVFFAKGISGGIVNTGANTLMQWTHGAKAGPFINALHFFFGLGAFLGPFLLGVLLSAGGVYWQAYTLLALADICVGIAVLSRLDAPRQPASVDAQPGSPLASRSYLLPMALGGMFFLFFYVSAEITFGSWLYTYAVGLSVADATQAAYLTSLFWLAFTIGRVVSIPVAIKVPPAPVLSVSLIVCAAFLGLLIVFPSSPTVLWVCVAAIGFCMAPMWPTGYNLAVQSIHLTARLGAVIVLGDSVGGMILPGLTGLFMERAGAAAMTQLVLGSVGATAVAAGLIVFFRARRQAALAE